MNPALTGFIFLLLIATAVSACLMKDILSSVIALSVFGVLLSIVFSILQAPDVALTQAVINSGMITSIFLVAYSQTMKVRSGEDNTRVIKTYYPFRTDEMVILFICIGLGFFLWKGIVPMGFSSLSGDAANHYINFAGVETGASNIVAAVLFDYRGFDTLGEIAVIFTTVTGISILFEGSRYHRSSSGLSFIVRRSMAFVIPLIILYASSIVLMGHLSPGGGFQGGTVLATASICFCVVYGSSFEAARIHPWIKETLESTGCLFFAGLGLIGLCTGAGFLANGAAGFPLGTQGTFISGGSIPLLNMAVGMKVGAGLSSLFYSMVKILEAPFEGIPGEVE